MTLNRLRPLAATLALTLALAGAAAHAAKDPEAAQTARLTPAEQDTVQRVERYLSGIDTLRADFLQTSSNGAVAEGQVWVERPGKLRFEYAPPHPALLVSNGELLLYYDRELEQTSYVPVSETPLWFLIRERIDIAEADNYALAGVEREKGVIRVHVVQKGSRPGQPGSVTLIFQDDPLALRKWRIVDQQGITTEVALINPRFGVAIDDKRFDFGALDLPEPGRQRPGR